MADLQDDVVEIETGGDTRRSRRIAPWIAGGVAIVVFALFIVLMTADTGRQESAASPLIGNVAPDAHGVLENGTPFDLSRRKGSWVVLNFFTHNCVPCIREHPELIEFAGRHEAAGDASVVSVVFDDEADEVVEFFGENGGDWPVVDGEDVILDWAVAQVPESFLVDPDGVVVARLVGGVTADGLDGLLEQAQGS